MEKRIKTLYVITIVAILAFLGMQAYWLYGRYEVSLGEQEDRIFSSIQREMDDYFNTYYKLWKRSDYISSYSISKSYDSVAPKSFHVEIIWYDRNKVKDLPVKDAKELDEGNVGKARNFMDGNLKHMAKSYEVDNAPKEGDLWTAMQKADLEFEYKMTARRVDSIMEGIGVRGEARLIETDTMVWTNTLERHSSLIRPTAVARIPYSELDRKSVFVQFAIPAGEILEGMWVSLAVAVLLSCFLIVCLALQIDTVLKLSRLDRMRNNFITTMIHELKRPISTLKMCVSGLENDRMTADAGIRKELLSETRQALDNLSAYFSKLRDITFNNVEQIPLHLQAVRLHRLFDDVAVSMTKPSDKDVEVINEIDADLEVSADATHLYNILSNLAENAVKYSGQSVEIRAEAYAGEGCVEIRISDTGNGIPAGDLKHIFKRFYRGKAAGGEQPGMGLGLAYVKLLVEAHGGEATVRSEEGKGTCFIIRLPQ